MGKLSPRVLDRSPMISGKATMTAAVITELRDIEERPEGFLKGRVRYV